MLSFSNTTCYVRRSTMVSRYPFSLQLSSYDTLLYAKRRLSSSPFVNRLPTSILLPTPYYYCSSIQREKLHPDPASIRKSCVSTAIQRRVQADATFLPSIDAFGSFHTPPKSLSLSLFHSSSLPPFISTQPFYRGIDMVCMGSSFQCQGLLPPPSGSSCSISESQDSRRRNLKS